MTKLPNTMHAWVIRGYGGAEAMKYERMPVPKPEPGELLLRIVAASVNPADWKIRQGYLKAFLPLTFPRVLGRDGVGSVVQAGADCVGFAPGDRVLAVADPVRDGTHAEYAAVPAGQSAKLPARMSASEAACLGVAGLSAYIPLADIAALTSGQRILIHAGAGGVGSVAIQMAKHLGAEVWTTCGTANVDFCKALGADRAIDYTRERFEQAVRECDVVFDTLGGEVHRQSFGVLKTGGLLVHLTSAPIDPVPPRADVRVVRADVRATTERLAALLAWAASGVIRAQPGKIFSLSEAREAYGLSASGHARGKILLAG